MANLTTAWNDGLLIAALVNAIAPGLCPEHEGMNPENSYENASYAMKLAEDWLGVPQVMILLPAASCSLYVLFIRIYTSLYVAPPVLCYKACSK